jgi:hypothetical protein
MATMVQMIRTYPTTGALLALGLPAGTGSVPDVWVQKRNMSDSLFEAVARCLFARVRLLLVHGAPGNVTNDRGHNLLITALHINDDDKRDRMFR